MPMKIRRSSAAQKRKYFEQQHTISAQSKNKLRHLDSSRGKVETQRLNTLNIENIDDSTLFRHDDKVALHQNSDSARDIIANVKINTLNKLLFRAIDTLNPIIEKYPKIGEKLIQFGETLIKLVDKVAGDFKL